ncbi:MAG: hypothetical protein WBW06_24350 [Xanthobacteraceae bacterium]
MVAFDRFAAAAFAPRVAGRDHSGAVRASRLRLPNSRYFEQRKVDFASLDWLLDWLDWTLFSVVPMFGDASLIAGAPGLIAEKPFAPYAIAGAITLLLLAGIYGAWSVTLWIARNRDKT